MPNAKRVILCVDDDDDILEFLRVVLEANNYTVRQAPSAEEGLRTYREAPPDLIICDLMMEEVDAGTLHHFSSVVVHQLREGTQSPGQ